MGGTTPPEDAFAALGNEVRIEILRVLTDAADSGTDRLAFSEIHDRIDVASTSRLSYHLSQLRDQFVRNVEDGYRLTQAGDRVVRAIRSGTYSERPSFEPITVEGECPACDGSVLQAAYHDPFLTVDCTDCETTLVTYNLPPAESRDRTSREILASCNQRVHREYAMALGGTCPMCSGRTGSEILQSERLAQYSCVLTCRHCDLRLYAPLEVRLLSHPAVIALYWKHDIDATNVPLWDLPTYIGDWAITSADEERGGYDVEVSIRGDRLQARISPNLDVTIRSADT